MLSITSTQKQPVAICQEAANLECVTDNFRLDRHLVKTKFLVRLGLSLRLGLDQR